jgi:hypothetical protein
MRGLVDAAGAVIRVIVALVAVIAGLVVAVALAGALMLRLAWARRRVGRPAPSAPARRASPRSGGLGAGEVVDIEPREVRPSSP